MSNATSRIGRSWLIIAVLVALSFCVVTAPFQGPDEVGHYWRAIAIARGTILPQIVGGKPTALVPRGVRDLVAVLWVPTAGRPDLQVGASRLRSAARIALQPKELVLVTFPAQYTPVPHLPAAAACFLGMALHVRPLVTFYLGRVCNAAALILLLLASVRRMGQCGAPIAAVGMLPMSLYVAGSYSPDAVTIGVACYVTALVLTPDGTRTYWSLLILSALLLALCKPVYFLLPLLAIVTTMSSWRSNIPRYALLLFAIVVGVGLAGLTARRNYFPMRADVVTNPAAQLAFVRAHPAHVLHIAARDYGEHALQYADHLVGHLGWLDIQLPKPLVMVTFLLLIGVGLATPAILTPRARVASVTIVAASCLLISLSQFLAWTPVGANLIDGMQGRYFLPLAPLALSSIALQSPQSAQRVVLRVFTGVVLLLNLVAIVAVFKRYY